MKRRSVGTSPKEDRDPTKLFPNGIKATLRSIRKFWPGDIRDEERSPHDFAKDFLYVYNKTHEKYGRKPPKEVPALKRVVDRVEGNGKSDSRNLCYAQLKAYAEYVEEIPVPVLLLFTQCVSAEQHGRPRKYIIDILQRAECVAKALQGYVNDGDEGELLFHKPNVDSSSYHARLKGLDIALKAFQNKK